MPHPQVFNPFEESDVIGITSYIDIGVRLVMPIAPPPGAGAGAAPSSAAADLSPLPSGLQLAAAWQVCITGQQAHPHPLGPAEASRPLIHHTPWRVPRRRVVGIPLRELVVDPHVPVYSPACP